MNEGTPINKVLQDTGERKIGIVAPDTTKGLEGHTLSSSKEYTPSWVPAPEDALPGTELWGASQTGIQEPLKMSGARINTVRPTVSPRLGHGYEETLPGEGEQLTLWDFVEEQDEVEGVITEPTPPFELGGRKVKAELLNVTEHEGRLEGEALRMAIKLAGERGFDAEDIRVFEVEGGYAVTDLYGEYIDNRRKEDMMPKPAQKEPTVKEGSIEQELMLLREALVQSRERVDSILDRLSAFKVEPFPVEKLVEEEEEDMITSMEHAQALQGTQPTAEDTEVPDAVILAYQSGERVADILNYWGLGTRQLYRILEKYNVPRRYKRRA